MLSPVGRNPGLLNVAVTKPNQFGQLFHASYPGGIGVALLISGKLGKTDIVEAAALGGTRRWLGGFSGRGSAEEPLGWWLAMAPRRARIVASSGETGKNSGMPIIRGYAAGRSIPGISHNTYGTRKAM